MMKPGKELYRQFYAPVFYVSNNTFFVILWNLFNLRANVLLLIFIYRRMIQEVKFPAAGEKSYFVH